MPKRTNTTPTNPESKRNATPQQTIGPAISTTTAAPTGLSQSQSSDRAGTFEAVRAFFAGSNLKPSTRDQQNAGIRSRTASQSTAASTASNHDPNKVLGGSRRGLYRNILEIDIFRVDGKPCTSNIDDKLIYNRLLRGHLKLKQAQINSFHTQWRGHPLIIVRLKEEVNVLNYAGIGQFVMSSQTATGEMDELMVDFEVRGQSRSNLQPQDENPESAWVRYVRIEGTGYDLCNEELTEWLTKYGILMSKFEETLVKYEDEHADTDEDSHVFMGTGKLSVKMRIETHIPQYLPMYGRKVKIHYRGIDKICTNCYEPGHYRVDCSSTRVPWIEYVEQFILSNNFDNHMYGSWMAKVADWRDKQPVSVAVGQASDSTADVLAPATIPPDCAVANAAEPTKKSRPKRQQKK